MVNAVGVYFAMFCWFLNPINFEHSYWPTKTWFWSLGLGVMNKLDVNPE
jgi:hypothetical protein